MIITLSPSKGQDFESTTPSKLFTLPEQLDDSQVLIYEAKKLDVESVRELMSVSENISTLNVQRFQDWQLPFNPKNAKAALFAFKGDVYSGIEKDKYDDDDLAYSQDHFIWTVWCFTPYGFNTTLPLGDENAISKSSW